MIKLMDILTEGKLNEGSDTFVNILNKFGFKKGARDWGGHQFFAHKSKDLYATYHPKSRSLVIEPKRGGKPVFDSDRSNFSIRALLSYLESPKNKFVSTEGKLTEGKFKMKGKYLYMPDGEVSSIPKRNDRDRIIIQIKNEKFELYDNGFNEFNIMGSRNSYHPKGQKDLERFLNKNKAKYIGID